MNFKEWLASFDEARLKGFQRLFRQQNPNMPTYVQDDLYNTRMAPSLAKSVGNDTQIPSTKPDSGNPNLSPNTIINRSSFAGSNWNKKPEILKDMQGRQGVTPKDFCKKTQDYFLDRRFGYREEKQIRNDAMRTEKQRELNKNKTGTNEPVIVKKVQDGYELLEGWHRTMTILLKGAPEHQLEILKNGYLNDVNFNEWRPVPINAYIGQVNNNDPNGTGDYTDPDGTGVYQYSSSHKF